MTAPACLDHLVYASPDFGAGVAFIEGLLGVNPVAGGRHPGRGTRNALVRLGAGAYLEVVGVDPDQRAPERPRWFGLDEAEGRRLATWCVRHPDPAGAVERVRGLGVELGLVEAGRRRRTDGSELSWRFTDPHADRAGGVVPFLIDWGRTRHPSRDLPEGGELLGLELGHPDASSLAPALRVVAPEAVIEEAPGPVVVAVIEGPRGVVRLS